jgi:hypothetical protein
MTKNSGKQWNWVTYTRSEGERKGVATLGTVAPNLYTVYSVSAWYPDGAWHDSLKGKPYLQFLAEREALTIGDKVAVEVTPDALIVNGEVVT